MISQSSADRQNFLSEVSPCYACCPDSVRFRKNCFATPVNSPRNLAAFYPGIGISSSLSDANPTSYSNIDGRTGSIGKLLIEELEQNLMNQAFIDHHSKVTSSADTFYEVLK